MTLMSARESAQDFIVKFLPNVCSVVVSLAGKMNAQSFAYHAHGTAGSDKPCCYPWFMCHNKTLDQQCMLLRLAPDDKSSY